MQSLKSGMRTHGSLNSQERQHKGSLVWAVMVGRGDHRASRPGAGVRACRAEQVGVGLARRKNSCDEEEHKLSYTDIFAKYEAMMEKFLADFCKEQGIKNSEFNTQLQEAVRDEPRRATAQPPAPRPRTAADARPCARAGAVSRSSPRSCASRGAWWAATTATTSASRSR